MIEKLRIALTSDEAIKYRDAEDTFFLGKWCLSLEELMEKKGGYKRTIKEHWVTNQELMDAFDFIERKSQRYLEILAKELNRLHNVDYSLRYWEIIIGSWIRRAIGVFYDRFSTIKDLLDESKLMNIEVSCGDCEIRTHFSPQQNFNLNSINKNIFCDLIILLQGNNFASIKYSSESRRKVQVNRPHARIKSLGRHLKKSPAVIFEQSRHYLLNVLIPGALKRFSLTVVIGGSLYLSLKDQLKFSWLVGLSKIARFEGIKLEFKGADSVFFDREKLLVSAPAEDDFDAVLNKLLPKYMPMLFLEYFASANKQILKKSPRRAEMIFTAFAPTYRPSFEMWAALQVEKFGAKYFAIQHGGGYGTQKYIQLNNQIIRVFDRYYTWGSSLVSSKVHQMPSLRLYGLSKLKLKHNNDGNILWLGNGTSLWYDAVQPYRGTEAMLKLVEDQRDFLLTLREDVKEKLLYRYVSDNLNQMEFFKKIYPNLKVCLGKRHRMGGNSDFYQSLDGCRLSVHVMEETTYLETMVSNFPTIIFFNYSKDFINESSVSSFELLINAGILHESGSAAGAKINEIFDDIESWWCSEQVQEARKIFCEKNALISNKCLEIWANEVKKQK